MTQVPNDIFAKLSLNSHPTMSGYRILCHLSHGTSQHVYIFRALPEKLLKLLRAIETCIN